MDAKNTTFAKNMALLKTWPAVIMAHLRKQDHKQHKNLYWQTKQSFLHINLRVSRKSYRKSVAQISVQNEHSQLQTVGNFDITKTD